MCFGPRSCIGFPPTGVTSYLLKVNTHTHTHTHTHTYPQLIVTFVDTVRTFPDALLVKLSLCVCCVTWHDVTRSLRVGVGHGIPSHSFAFVYVVNVTHTAGAALTKFSDIPR